MGSVWGQFGVLLLAAVPFAAEHAQVCAVLFFLASVELAVVDLLCEGKYAEMMVKNVSPHPVVQRCV